jgi:hypothetical protein
MVSWPFRLRVVVGGGATSSRRPAGPEAPEPVRVRIGGLDWPSAAGGRSTSDFTVSIVASAFDRQF